MEPEGEDEDPPPSYRSSESSASGTETPRWGDMDEDDDMDFDYTKEPPSSDPPRRPSGDPPGPPGGGPSGPPGGRPPGGPLEADHRAGEDPLDRADPAETLLEDPLGTLTTHQGTTTRMPPGGGLSTSAEGSSPSSER